MIIFCFTDYSETSRDEICEHSELLCINCQYNIVCADSERPILGGNRTRNWGAKSAFDLILQFDVTYIIFIIK